MTKNILHITNGGNLTNYLIELDYKGEYLTWHEMLCEGPTKVKIDSDAFLKVRKDFLKEFYQIEIDEQKYKTELQKLDNISNYSEIVLWFEYDLFCHINMLAIISLLREKQIKKPISLVCSGRIPGEENLKALTELTAFQIDEHFKERIYLSKEDKEFASNIWEVYCGSDHNLLKPFITEQSTFEYLSICLKAHLKRFPDSVNGLSELEHNIIKILDKYEVKSRHHLLGYALNYQGYYGFSDIQLMRVIDKLSLFFIQEEDSIKLNRKGYEVLLNQRNYASEINDNMQFGEVNRLDYLFNKKENKLIKTILHAN
ncbi:DUF1835 domain-containing protein [Oceanihabitans sediminis]|uniref:DUF1835 domain-containing protein n=1 Tax=Oceanihabitans sediminis TaxID=1812012 RepID=A0A368P509_9FLAO|nr:DUF1835 domain-containing protein [Oceanihabitans sediminis]MDX1277258.1 DUF1835 domain-containing protein [Oceanihabitans sediminis]MDX1773677.1 DUF1835 domain-containing protein [Oceanihabitans sediminis]RBP33121.1 uncharacterized protein DUF1835 [Oceanihabitans sediminis]RCU57370.1 DUF1835 domain-containing protein [Oceanihabitans sediminis]